jgi:hypothetical protein
MTDARICICHAQILVASKLNKLLEFEVIYSYASWIV